MSEATKSAEVTFQKIGEALGPIEDPEIHISIVELGLIYGAEISDSKEGDGKKVKLTMSLTSPACPYGPMLLASVVISFVAIAGAIQQEIKELVKDVPIAQFTAWDISRVSFFILPTMAGYVFPITFLFGILLTFGLLARNSELIAMQASGIPLRRVVTPVIVAGAALSGLCFWVQDVGQPWAYQRLAQLLHSDLPLRITLDMLPTGVMHDYGAWRVYIGEKDPDGVLRNIVVLSEDEDGVTMIHAEEARLLRGEEGSSLEMRNVYRIPPGLRQIERTDPLTLAVPGLDPRDEGGGRREGLSLRGLLAAHARLDEAYEKTPTAEANDERHKLRLEIAKRAAFPLMCLAVSFAGAPLGARTRRAGRSYAFAGGFIIVGTYFVLRKAVEPLSVAAGLGGTVLLGQLPNILLCAAGAYLLWKVDRV